jgi:hypothetical protein
MMTAVHWWVVDEGRPGGSDALACGESLGFERVTYHRAQITCPGCALAAAYHDEHEPTADRSSQVAFSEFWARVFRAGKQ